jgi:hypothetical protein
VQVPGAATEDVGPAARNLPADGQDSQYQAQPAELALPAQVPAPREPAEDFRLTRRAQPLPWVIGAIAAAGVAWLAMALVTFLTSYPVLRVSSWQIATSGMAGAKLSFSVFNDGNEAATGCHAGVRLEDGRLLSRTAPAIPMHRTALFIVPYRESESLGRHRAYLWARCGAAITARTAIHAPPDVLLTASAPTASASASTTTVRFQVHNAGADSASNCSALVGFSNGKFVSQGGQPDVPTRSAVHGDGPGIGFAITYRTALGAPQRAWAVCTTPNIRIVSTRVPVPGLPARAANPASSRI